MSGEAPPLGASGTLTIEEIHQLFAPPVVRVLLDWAALRRHSTPIELRILSSPADLHRFYTTWYIDPARKDETSFHATRSRPLRISELPTARSMLASERVVKMAEIALAQGSDVPCWVVPCYQLPHGDLLLLDGNHRLGALALHGLAARILGVVILGPVDPSVLPDLGAWAPGL